MEGNNFIEIFEQDILQIKNIIKKNLKDNNSRVEELMSNVPADEGKLIRAILVLIGASFGTIEKNKLLEIGAAVELLHLATLIHDDIIDETSIRRGKECIHKKYSIKSGIFAGDYLFSEAYVLFSKNCMGNSIKQVSETIKFICRGEIEQYFSLNSLNTSIKDYLKRINGKCASLFSLSLSIGASESHAKQSHIKKLSYIGYCAGMAFQLKDDLLDLTSTSDFLGKPTGNDLKQGIYSMPVIYELKKGNQELKYLLKERNVNQAIILLRSSEGIKKTEEIIEKYTSKAMLLIDELPSEGKKEELKKIIEKMQIRNY